MIKVNDISKSYGSQLVLASISFTLNEGEIIGLLGVNGAGKSTLMKVLSGILPPDAGDVNIYGNSIMKNALDAKRIIGYVSEDNPLYEDMYVREYIEYVASVYSIDKKLVPSVLEKVGLQKEYVKKISSLSKGNRQRVGIAQALIHDPQFLILDEAASGLDPNQRESLNKLIEKISKDKIILLSTHILSDVKELCSRFIVMDKGRIVADNNINSVDSVENIFQKLTYEDNSR